MRVYALITMKKILKRVPSIILYPPSAILSISDVFLSKQTKISCEAGIVITVMNRKRRIFNTGTNIFTKSGILTPHPACVPISTPNTMIKNSIEVVI